MFSEIHKTFAEIHKIFSVLIKSFSKNAQNLSSKNTPNVFLNTRNLSIIMHKMFPELHQRQNNFL